MADNDIPAFLLKHIGMLAILAFFLVSAFIILMIWVSRSRSYNKIALVQSLEKNEGFSGVENLESYVGQEVTVLSDLKPSGKVQTYDGRIHESVLLLGGFVSKGEKLVVAYSSEGRLYVRK